MKTLKLVALFIAGILVGAVAANQWDQRVFWSASVPKQVDSASMAMFEANWLAGLRLNEANNVTRDMEQFMDSTVTAIAAWDGVSPADERSRKMRDHFLLSVKLYHESFPASGEGAEAVKAFLAAVPGRVPTKECGSAICRLDAQHRGVSGAASAPATK